MYIYLMLLRRNHFFLLLLLIFIAPIVAYKVCWLACSEKTLGVMCFTDHPSDARIDIPTSIWGDTLAWALYPFLVILVLYLTPQRLQPLIPEKAHIRLTIKRPFIKIESSKPACP